MRLLFQSSRTLTFLVPLKDEANDVSRNRPVPSCDESMLMNWQLNRKPSCL